MPATSERRWAAVRMALGLGQMFGALFAVVLLVSSGITRIALVATLLTCVLTIISVILFGAHKTHDQIRPEDDVSLFGER